MSNIAHFIKSAKQSYSIELPPNLIVNGEQHRVTLASCNDKSLSKDAMYRINHNGSGVIIVTNKSTGKPKDLPIKPAKPAPATPAKPAIIEVQADIETLAPPVPTGIEHKQLSEGKKSLNLDSFTGTGTPTDEPSNDDTMPPNHNVNAHYDDMGGIPTPFDSPATTGSNVEPWEDAYNDVYKNESEPEEETQAVELWGDEHLYEGDHDHTHPDNTHDYDDPPKDNSYPPFEDFGFKSTRPQPDTMPVTHPTADKPAFTLGSFSLRGQSELMRAKMLTDTFVMDRIAILGQATVIYAKPNTGKTALSLWLIIESIKAHRINGEDVFYINADDDYKGIVFKTKLAEHYGFEMLAPSHNGFEAKALMGYMRQMINDDTARGKVIILDTLKKFTDLMNKKTGSEFMNRAREFVASGGTLIMLAHTNKNRDTDGKAVFGGTSDIVDDCDCAFILDEISVNGTTKQVLFENIKSRGDVARELAFSYSITEKQSYSELMDSIEVVDGASVEQAKKDKAINAKREKDKPAINAITETIEQGINLKTELIETASKSAGISKRILTAVLDSYNGQLWRESIGARNAKSYHLIPIFEANEYTYGFAKNGN